MKLFARGMMLLIPLFLVSCMQPQADTAGLKKTIDEFNAASIEAMTTNNSAKVAPFYAEDAVSMPPNEGPVKGRENIMAWMKKMGDMGVKIKTAKFSTVESDAAGNVGYEVGEYEMTMEMAPMGEMADNGKYLAIFKKQQDGSWKVHAEMWNSSKPMPSMEMPMDNKKPSKKK